MPLTINEAANALGLGVHTIRAWISQGCLTHVRLGRAIRVLPSAIEDLLINGTVEATRGGTPKRSREIGEREREGPDRSWVTLVGKRQPNYRFFKIHRTSTVGEAVDVSGNHKNTVRSWIKAGLPTIDNKYPTLIRGQELIAFLQSRRLKRKKPCAPGQL
jgi:excisionase family DNA binding protein